MPLCRTFLYHDDLPFKLLRESTTYFGCNPRRCFEASSSVDKLKDRMNSVVDAVRKPCGMRPATTVWCSCLSGLKWVATTSPIGFFKFSQPMNNGCSRLASSELSRNGLWISC